jgi:hypothetical protein
MMQARISSIFEKNEGASTMARVFDFASGRLRAGSSTPHREQFARSHLPHSQLVVGRVAARSDGRSTIHERRIDERRIGGLVRVSKGYGGRGARVRARHARA